MAFTGAPAMHLFSGVVELRSRGRPRSCCDQLCHFVDVVVHLCSARTDVDRLAICVVRAYRFMRRVRLVAYGVRSAGDPVSDFSVTVLDLIRLAAIGGVGHVAVVVSIPFSP